MVKKQTLGFTGAGWRFLVFVFAASWLVPMSGDLIAAKVVKQRKEGLYQYHGSRGPWAGIRNEDDTWSHENGPTRYTFTPGETVVWETRTDVVAGTTVSAEATLVCASKTIFVQDFHTYASQKREGWKNFGMTLPIGAPYDDCGIVRKGLFTGPGGEVETSVLPIIPVRIVPERAAP